MSLWTTGILENRQDILSPYVSLSLSLSLFLALQSSEIIAQVLRDEEGEEI